MKYYGNEPQHVGPYYCSNCGWGLPGIPGRFPNTHPIGPGDEKCPSCQASPDEALVFPTKEPGRLKNAQYASRRDAFEAMVRARTGLD